MNPGPPVFVPRKSEKPLPEFKPSSHQSSAQVLDSITIAAQQQKRLGAAPTGQFQPQQQYQQHQTQPPVKATPVPKKRKRIIVKSSSTAKKKNARKSKRPVAAPCPTWTSVEDAEQYLTSFMATVTGGDSQEEFHRANHDELVAKLQSDVGAAEQLVEAIQHKVKFSQHDRADSKMQCVAMFYNLNVMKKEIRASQKRG